MSGRMGRSSTARRRPEDAAAIRVQGNLDQVTPDGLVIGWCWSPDQPLSRRPVAVLVDGTEAVRATCGLDRSDLRKAGLGDGLLGIGESVMRAQQCRQPGRGGGADAGGRFGQVAPLSQAGIAVDVAFDASADGVKPLVQRVRSTLLRASRISTSLCSQRVETPLYPTAGRR